MRALHLFLASLLAFVCAFVVLPRAAHAKGDNKSIGVYAEGPDAEEIRAAVVSAMPEGITVVDASKVKDAFGKAGLKAGLGKAFDNPKQRDKILDKVRKAAQGGSIDAVLIARSSSVKGKSKVHFFLVEASGEGTSFDEEVSLPAKSKKKPKDSDAARRKAIADAVTPPLEKLAPAASTGGSTPEETKKPEETEETPKEATDDKEKKEGDEEEEKEDATPAGARPKHDVMHSLFEVSGGLDVGIRKFDYTDRVSKNLRGYSVSGAPGVFLGGELFPGAGGSGVLRDIGLYVFYARSLFLKSAPSGGEKIDSTWQRYDIGLRVRIRTGSEKSPMLGIDVGYGGESFTFASAGLLDTESPSVSYKFLRLGLDARFPIGGFAVLAGAAYLPMLGGGDVADRFTSTKLSGLDFRLGVAMKFAEAFEARLLGRYTRIGYSFSSRASDTFQAGGASDALMSAMLGVAYVF